jgi:pyruvate kinase
MDHFIRIRTLTACLLIALASVSLADTTKCFSQFSTNQEPALFSEIGIPFINTLGPKSHGLELDMVRAGTRVFRVNTSHIVDPALVFSTLRNLDATLSKDPQAHLAGVLVDLPGLKMRVTLPNESQQDGLVLDTNQSIILTADSYASEFQEALQLPKETFDRILPAIRQGSKILIDDGKVELYVETVADNHIVLRNLQSKPFTILNRKGINVPNTPVQDASFLPLDQSLLRASLLSGRVSHVALSFVQSGEDMQRVRKFIADFRIEMSLDLDLLSPGNEQSDFVQKKYSEYLNADSTLPSQDLVTILRYASKSPEPLLIAKIENYSGVVNSEEIATFSDGLMVARGDLNLELNPVLWIPARVMIEKAAEKMNGFSIVATGVLTSSSNDSFTVRSELEGIATILKSRSALMTSEETAMGGNQRGPVEIIEFAALTSWNSSLAQALFKTDTNSLGSNQAETIIMTRFSVDEAYEHPDIPGEVFLSIHLTSLDQLKVLNSLPEGYRAIVFSDDIYLLRMAQSSFGVKPVFLGIEDDSHTYFSEKGFTTFTSSQAP